MPSDLTGQTQPKLAVQIELLRIGAHRWVAVGRHSGYGNGVVDDPADPDVLSGDATVLTVHHPDAGQ